MMKWRTARFRTLVRDSLEQPAGGSSGNCGARVLEDKPRNQRRGVKGRHLGQGISRIALGGDGQAAQPQGSRHRHGHRHPSILERERGIGAETAMMPPLVLDFEMKTNAAGQRMSIRERWRAVQARWET
jgi:hypothetical protein